ncbi:response regulator transcription factor [Nakamurella sp. A5-74]|uniref:Response regulator transcription factor n=1 Tax=Nakamurella sp. A5-74 TaxID=3158264 RepID=A0AAU8DQY5_9ACTN
MTEDAAVGQDISVLVVDDQTAIREAMAIVIDLQADLRVSGTAADGERAVEAAALQRPDVVLMDLNMPGIGGAEATRQILAAADEIAVVVLTTFADEESILTALGAGARGYLTKDAGRADILRAIRSAAAGQAVLDPAVQARLLAAAGRSRSGPPVSPAASAPQMDSSGNPGSVALQPLSADLTPREREVLALIGEGLPNRAIAQRLFVSDSTVKTHINNLFAKVGARDRVQAARLAIAHGLVTLEH